MTAYFETYSQRFTRGIVAVAVALLMTGALALFSPATTYAADPPADDPACAATSKSGQDALDGAGLTGADCNGASTKINGVLKTLINLLSAIVGVVAVIMIVVGGFKYITSGGDSNKTASAKNTIVYAIIGLVIVALAQILVHFVINSSTGATAKEEEPKASVLLYRV
jgi:lysylphosphatidylglycerol synthetase-like protein (DUF2156 family)